MVGYKYSPEKIVTVEKVVEVEKIVEIAPESSNLVIDVSDSELDSNKEKLQVENGTSTLTRIRIDKFDCSVSGGDNYNDLENDLTQLVPGETYGDFVYQGFSCAGLYDAEGRFWYVYTNENYEQIVKSPIDTKSYLLSKARQNTRAIDVKTDEVHYDFKLEHPKFVQGPEFYFSGTTTVQAMVESTNFIPHRAVTISSGTRSVLPSVLERSGLSTNGYWVARPDDFDEGTNTYTISGLTVYFDGWRKIPAISTSIINKAVES